MAAQRKPGEGNDAPQDEKDDLANGIPDAAELQEEAVSELAADGGEEVTPDSDDPLAVLRDEAEKLRQETAELKNQLLRALAETENVRKRGQRDREEALRYAAAPLAKDLLPVADNLRRAIEAVSPEAAEQDERLKSLLVGVEMTEKSLLDTLAKHGVSPVDPLGERLDPHRHEAMMEIPDPSKPHGTISQVFEIGYVLHDRLLRPARVAVATGTGASQPSPGAKDDL